MSGTSEAIENKAGDSLDLVLKLYLKIVLYHKIARTTKHIYFR